MRYEDKFSTSNFAPEEENILSTPANTFLSFFQHYCQQAVGQAKKMVDDYRDTYDIRVAEDKVMEKNFRKEFPDVNAAIVDQLARVYRRRPRLVLFCFVVFCFVLFLFLFWG